MSRMIQIRHVPVRLHQLLKTRAARAGMTLSDYLRGELERAAHELTLDEIEARLAQLPPVRVSPSPVRVVREARDAE